MMKPRTFVISLPGSTTRQESIAAQLARHQIDFSWKEAVNGRSLDEQTLGRVYDAERAEREGGRQLSRGEIGCALSHLDIYQTMLDQELDTVLVLEDDAALSSNFGEQHVKPWTGTRPIWCCSATSTNTPTGAPAAQAADCGWYVQ